MKNPLKKIQKIKSKKSVDKSSYSFKDSSKDDEKIPKLCFEVRSGVQPQVWDKLSWKRIEIESIPEIENNGMFLGIEEVDGDQLSFLTTHGTQKSVKNEDEIISKTKDKKLKRKREEEKMSIATIKSDYDCDDEQHSDALDISSGNSSTHSTITDTTTIYKEDSPKSKKQKKQKKDNHHQQSKLKIKTTPVSNYLPIPTEEILWDNIRLPSVVVSALNTLGFISSTPIQASSIPVTLQSSSDIVGVAETGSGKTLAFIIPILYTIIKEWNIYGKSSVPMSLIIAPTRELVMQITTVFNEFARCLEVYGKISVVTIIGGMSEQKQKRLLSNTHKRSVHVIVATPGRLHEMIFENDGDITIFDDMSRYRYLVVDEVDRIMEEGHFNELHRIFSRIREHEKLCDEGKSPIEIARKRIMGEAFQREDDDDDNEHDDDNEEMEDVVDEKEDEETMNIENDVNGIKDEVNKKDFGVPNMPDYISKQRQTLLFSATANQKQMIDYKKKGKKIKGIGDGAVRFLPRHIQELLALVGVKKKTEVIDVTASNMLTKIDSTNHSILKPTDLSTSNLSLASLPKTLKQYEVRVPAEDKDIFAYQFLLQLSLFYRVVERTLIFVNSIKTARRLDGLLRALDLNCRAIHAELQQKQRIKALESFQSSPIGILVATDVAARGLDIPKINTVLHYDIARSPQLYIHRSGRTARASASGMTLSLVTPEDIHHHEIICSALQVKRLEIWRNRTIDRMNENLIQERVKLAKKIFTQSFVLSQRSKEDVWIKANAANTGLDMDEITEEDILSRIGGNNNGKSGKLGKSGKKAIGKEAVEQEMIAKKALIRMKVELKQLLETSAEVLQRSRNNKPKFIVVAK